MKFKVNHYYLYQEKVYRFIEQTTFPSGYSLYFFEENENGETLILGEEDIEQIVEY